MKRLTFIYSIFCLLAYAGCNQAKFSNDGPKKTSPRDGDGNPLQPSSGNPPADCTAMSEDQCRQERLKENTDQSFRNVDCSSKSFSDCEAAVNKEKLKDGDLKSEIRVKNCSDTDGKSCEDLIAKVNPPTDGSGNSTDTSTSTDMGIDVGSGDKISKFELDASQAFDGIVNFCLDYASGLVTVTDGGSRFFGSNVVFNVTRGDSTPSLFVIAGTGSRTVPKWKKACDANPTTPGWEPVLNKKHNPPELKVNKSGTKVCLYVDDGEGGRPGAINITNFDFGLKYCD